MSSKRSPARLVIALSIAAALAVFILYTSAFASSTPALKPSQLPGHKGTVNVVGAVVGPVTGNNQGAGMRFRLREIGGSATVAVVYHGSVPDQFKVGGHVTAGGKLVRGTFVSTNLMTKCPSKYQPKRA